MNIHIQMHTAKPHAHTRSHFEGYVLKRGHKYERKRNKRERQRKTKGEREGDSAAERGGAREKRREIQREEEGGRGERETQGEKGKESDPSASKPLHCRAFNFWPYCDTTACTRSHTHTLTHIQQCTLA